MKLQRMVKGVKRVPLRTFKEFAAEFGITHQTLAAYMLRPDAPVPELEHKHNKWYEVPAMRKWWAQIQQEKKEST